MDTAMDRRRRIVPWQGRATRTDVALVAAVLAVVAFGLVLRPLQPFLIASHPVLLALLTGDRAAIGAAAAFARIGEVPLGLVVVAGTVGMVRFDWLTWWAGRQWGAGVLAVFTVGDRAGRIAARAQELNPWTVRAAVVFAGLPGVPSAVVFAVAGWTGMRLGTFLLLDLAGALLMTGLVAGLGFALGQHAVDAVLLVESYAVVVSIAMLVLTAALPLVRRWIRGRRPSSSRTPRPGRPG